MSPFVLTLITAAASALLTLIFAYFFLRLIVLPKAKRSLEAELLPKFQARVKAGMLEAGEELLPKLRENVRDGVSDALHDAVSGKFVEDAASNAVRNGLNALLGRNSKNTSGEKN